MQELIDGELVTVDDPLGVGEVMPNGIAVGFVRARRLGVVPVELIQEEEIAENLDARDEITAARTGLPIQRVCFLLIGFLSGLDRPDEAATLRLFMTVLRGHVGCATPGYRQHRNQSRQDDPSAPAILRHEKSRRRSPYS